MVLFPEPFAPTMTHSCPAESLNDTSRRAYWSDPGYRKETFLYHHLEYPF